MKLYLMTILFLISMLISSCSLSTEYTPPPTDKELIQKYNDNKKIFTEIKNRLLKESHHVISLDPKWSDPSDLSLEIKENYYALMNKVNIKQISNYKGAIYLTLWSHGNVSGGGSKGYVFKPELSPNGRLFKTKKSLDNISRDKEFFYKRKIEGEWNLFYENTL